MIFDQVHDYEVTKEDKLLFQQIFGSEDGLLELDKVLNEGKISKSNFYKSLEYFEKLGFKSTIKQNKYIQTFKSKSRLTPIDFFDFCPRRFIKDYHYFTTINSTHEYANRLIKTKAVEQALILAEYQSSGRGRTGRKWFSKLGKGILASVILNISHIENSNLNMLPVAISLSAAEISNAKISWPNDIVCNGKKIGGTLVSLSIKGEEKYAVFSLGLNVFGDKNTIPASIKNATTMENEKLIDSKWQNPRAHILKKWLESLEQKIKDISNPNNIFESWNKMLIDRGRKIFWINSKGQKVHGKFINGCENGNALVENEKHQKFEITAEETPFYCFK